MKLKRVSVCVCLSLFLLMGVVACSETPSNQGQPGEGLDKIGNGSIAEVLSVFKSPQCGCCGKWVDYMESAGFRAKVNDTNDLDQIKSRYNIPRQLQSCHTAISEEGYIFEGHIPSAEIKRFLEEKPANALGLSVPGMPVGSPGMEMGNKLMPYQVLLLMEDGSTKVYAEINDLE